jgi:hypothetical protein
MNNNESGQAAQENFHLISFQSQNYYFCNKKSLFIQNLKKTAKAATFSSEIASFASKKSCFK